MFFEGPSGRPTFGKKKEKGLSLGAPHFFSHTDRNQPRSFRFFLSDRRKWKERKGKRMVTSEKEEEEMFLWKFFDDKTKFPLGEECMCASWVIQASVHDFFMISNAFFYEFSELLMSGYFLRLWCYEIFALAEINFNCVWILSFLTSPWVLKWFTGVTKNESSAFRQIS